MCLCGYDYDWQYLHILQGSCHYYSSTVPHPCGECSLLRQGVRAWICEHVKMYGNKSDIVEGMRNGKMCLISDGSYVQPELEQGPGCGGLDRGV